MAQDTGEIKINWYRTPLSKEQLRELTQRSDLKGWLQILPYIAILVVTSVAAFYALHHFPVYALVIILFLHGTVFAFVLNGFHELTHGTVFKTKGLNAIFLRVFSFLGWLSHVEYKASHMRHHLYTLHPPYDLEVLLPVRLKVRDYLLLALVDLPGLYKNVVDTVEVAFGRVHGRWREYIFPESDPQQRRRLRNWARITLLGHAVIIAVSIAGGQWLLAVLISGGRFYGMWLQWLCNTTQHVGLMDNVPDFRLSTRTIKVNPLVEYLYFRMNYHAEHHMYASIPCYNLRRLRKTIEADMPLSKWLLPAWKEIISIVKRQRSEPSYQFKYQLPGNRGK